LSFGSFWSGIKMIQLHGPGGQSILPDKGADLLIYHWYDGSGGCGCELGINTLSYNDGWPTVH
jgi:arabinan endo-1,5-alpha-L-arabinosidase